MRATLVRVHDRLDLAEVRLVLELVEHVHRDIAGFAPLGRAERDIVGRHRADLDREADQEAGALDHRADLSHRVHQRFARHRVLQLGEPDQPLVGEDPVAAVDRGAA